MSAGAAGAAAPAPEAECSSNWWQLALGWLLYFCFGAIIASPVPVVSLIRSDLDLSFTEMGAVLGAWQLFFIGAAAPAGLLIDRVGPKKALIVGALIITLSAVLRAYAEGFWTLFLAVGVFGIGGPVISIGLAKLVADWFVGPSRGLASGIYITGAAAGSMVVLALTNSFVLPAAGSWRNAILVYAAFSLFICLVWTLFGRDSPRSISDRGETAGRPPRKGGYLELLRNPMVWIIVMIGFSSFMATHGVRNWLPQILEARGFSPSDAGLLGALPALTGIFGSILILRLATGEGRRVPFTIGLLAVAGLGVIIIMLSEGWLLVLAIAVEGFCAAAITPLMLNTLMETKAVGARHIGAAAGIYFSVGEVGGTLAPFLLGVTVDLTGSFSVGMYGLAIIIWAMIIPATRIRL